MRQGGIGYKNADGGTTLLSRDDLTRMDPQGIGPSNVAMHFFQTYPLPNDHSVGDGLNYSSFRFAAPIHNRFDTYIARFDYQLTGNHSLFWRGTLQNDVQHRAPYLPGLPPLDSLVDYNKGFVVGLTSILKPTLVNTLRWGFTRQSEATLGNSNQPWILFPDLNANDYGYLNFSYSAGFLVPVHNIVDDLSWKRNRHSFKFGINTRFIRNPRTSLTRSFSEGGTIPGYLPAGGIANTGTDMDPAVYGFSAVADGFDSAYDSPLMALMGSVNRVRADYNYDKQGNLLDQGAPTHRHFAADEYEFYGQDQFQVKPNLTFTYGLRWELLSPPWETTGLQVGPNVNMASGLTSVPPRWRTAFPPPRTR